MMGSFRGAGAQVHAVPDEDRALDNRGQPLPWGYSYADTNLNRKTPADKGPFGKISTARRSTRSKTNTPSKRGDDLAKAENMLSIDNIFDDFKMQLQAEHSKTTTKPGRVNEGALQTRAPTLSQSRSPYDASPPSNVPAAEQTAATAQPAQSTFKEPTEIMIYGYGLDHQYAALTFFEQASGGSIYEDYDREPTQPRFASALSSVRSTIPKNLHHDTIRKINTYQGGIHWIKVTLDSPQAAELAIGASPHVISGYNVFAEMWRGVGPNQDVPIPAGRSGPRTLNQRRIARQGPRDFGSAPGRIHAPPSNSLPDPFDAEFSASTDSTQTEGRASSSTATVTGTDLGFSATQQNSIEMRRLPESQPRPNLKIPSATRAIFLKSSDALLPKTPKGYRLLSSIPVVGWLFTSGPTTGIIGSSVPRKDDNAFDWEKASLWWRFWMTVDIWFGTDMCGIKGDD